MSSATNFSSFFFAFFFSFFFLFHVFVLPDLDFLIQSSIKWYVLEVIWYRFTGRNKKYRPVWYGNDFHGYGWWIRSKLQGWLDIQVLWVWLCASSNSEVFQVWGFSETKSLRLRQSRIALYIHKERVITWVFFFFFELNYKYYFLNIMLYWCRKL